MLIEYDEWPDGTSCCECRCDDSTIDLVPTEDGDWICAECFSRQDWDSEEDEQSE